VGGPPGFSGLSSFGRRSPAGTYLCHTPRPALPEFIPTLWLSDTDQTSESDEITCRLIEGPGVGAARTVLRLLLRGF